MSPRPGNPAPEFTLRDQHGRCTSLSGFRGERAVLLVFYPYAFSRVCTGELGELQDRYDELGQAGAEVLAISCDPMFTLRAFSNQDGLELPLLSDFWPHGEVAAAYGVLDEEHGCARRSSFLVDRDGVVRWSVHNPMGEARSVEEYLRQIRGLQAASK